MRCLVRFFLCASILVGIYSSVLAKTENFGVGLELNNFNGAGTNLALSYFTDHFSASLQGSVQNNPRSTTATKYTQVNVLVGLRQQFAKTDEHKAYFTYGLLGSDFMTSNPDALTAKNIYTYGVYVGVDYNLLQNFVVSAQMYPYTRAQDNLKGNASQTSDNYFDNGSVAFTYLF